jgi:hypothetical protein
MSAQSRAPHDPNERPVTVEQWGFNSERLHPRANHTSEDTPVVTTSNPN